MNTTPAPRPSEAAGGPAFTAPQPAEPAPLPLGRILAGMAVMFAGGWGFGYLCFLAAGASQGGLC